jgi:hypothetical protein
MTWEYRVIEPLRRQEAVLLAALGRNGWELVSAVASAEDSRAQRLYLKRRVPAAKAKGKTKTKAQPKAAGRKSGPSRI